MPLRALGIRELAARMGRIDAELRAELEPATLEAGNIIGDQVKANASFSSRLPGQVSVAASFSASGGGAVVKVAAGEYPHVLEARVMEGDGIAPSEFRHPVYGNPKGWASQMSHPFAHPAVEDKRTEAVAVIAAAVHTVLT